VSKPYAEVIGDPIAQSKSPAIHNFWLGKLGINAEYRACLVRPEELEGYFTQRRRDAEWRGCNVTMPHKLSVMPLLDVIDAAALLVGAVNTIVREAGTHLSGFNTDVVGFLEPLLPLIAKQGIGKISVVGTGGAARAAISGLTQIYSRVGEAGLEARIVLVGRDQDRALNLVKELAHLAQDGQVSAMSIDKFRAMLESLETGGGQEESDGVRQLVVNASAMGMIGKPPIDVNLSGLPEGSVVYDIVTHPVDTDLLSEARAHGLETIDGLSMLIGQAAAAFEKFFGQPAPRQHDVELRALLTA
jgi:shikimate dehydrogenase